MEDDSKRRDLKINSLYYDLKTNEIIDLNGGLSDLKNGIIRTVGNPNDRFKEDKLRRLRCIRFAARFGSDLDPEADKALKQDSSLEGISSERIRDEFLKGIKSAKSVNRFIAMLNMYDMFKWIFGSLRVDLTSSNEVRDPIVLIANLLRQNEPNAVKTQLNKLTYTSEEIGKISFLLALLKFRPDMIMLMKKLETISKITPEQIKEFASINNLDVHMIDAFLNFKLSVKADEFMNAGMKAGSELGNAINNKEIQLFNQSLV